jgi:hypothetical protein
VSDYPDEPTKWYFDLRNLHASIEVPLRDEGVKITLPKRKLRLRLRESQVDERVEPFSLAVKNDSIEVNEIAKKYAKHGHVKPLVSYLKDNLEPMEGAAAGSDQRSVFLSKQAFQHIDQKKFITKFENLHHDLTVLTAGMRSDPFLVDTLMTQVGPYLGKAQLNALRRKIDLGKEIRVDKELLPPFAKQMVGQFTIYRGPNCFHASLAFQDSNFTNSPGFNVKEEKGYHRAMINYDELWRTLKSEFYEIDVSRASLKYGDIIVFFDLPERSPKDVNFKWIRHATTYLFNGYSFSKGSKSPNTPYSIKTLKEEWETWKGYTSLMAVKVFRKSGRSVNKSPAANLCDWLD